MTRGRKTPSKTSKFRGTVPVVKHRHGSQVDGENSAVMSFVCPQDARRSATYCHLIS